MTRIFAEKALLAEGWAQNVLLTLTDGAITAIETDARPTADCETVAVAVPGMANLHSHAFQRAMAGLAETRGPGADSFWSWRTVMYRQALAMEPEDVTAIAGELYMTMLEAGFTRVGEFHYLHHDRDGAAFGQIAEMAARIADAADTSGIGLTLLPVFYAHAGFGAKPPQADQRRFISTPDQFARLIEESRGILAALPGARLGIAPHSLRAVAPEHLPMLMDLAGSGPVHIHVAEQVKEVEDCLAWSGARPVEWLLDHAPVDQRWCLIHATHMTASETTAVAKRGAIAGLCPITEANLGDGTFPATQFLAAGGRFGVGSDSNIAISLPGELVQLEYSQRLAGLARNVIAAPGHSTGARLFSEAVTGGAAALGEIGGLKIGAAADVVSLDASLVFATSADQILDAWIFSDRVKVDQVWAGGRHVVKNGRHIRRETILAAFKRQMQRLVDRAE